MKSPKSKKGSKWTVVLGIVLPIVLAAAIIWYFNRSKNKKKADQPDSLPNSQAAKPLRAVSDAEFPLKQGSKGDMVRQLQNALITAYGSSVLPKYGADADWGSETTTAVRNKLGVAQLNSQVDFDKAIEKLQGVVSTANNSSRGHMLVDKWKGNSTLQLMGGVGGTLIYGMAVDAFGALNATGTQLFLGSNQKYPRDQYALVDVTQNGYVVLQKLTGDRGPAGMYKVASANISVG